MYNAIKTELKRLKAATGFSWQGLKATYRGEAAFRLEVYLSIILIPAALLLGGSAVECAFLIAVWVLVLLAELLNSAIEAIVDRISLDKHELSGRAKDMGSAAVFVMMVNAGVVWLVILLG